MSDDAPDFAATYDRERGGDNPVVALLATAGRRHWATFSLATAVTVLSTLLSLAPPYLLGVAIDGVVVADRPYSLLLVPDAWLPETRQAQFLLTLGLLLGAGLLSTVFGATSSLAWSWFQHQSKHDLRTQVYDATQYLGLAFFESAQTGDVMSVLHGDLEQLDRVLNDWLVRVFTMVLTAVGMAAVMLVLHWQLALVALALTPVIAGLTIAYTRRIFPRYLEAREEIGDLNARLRNDLEGIQTIKVFGAEDRETERFATHSRAFRDYQLRIGRLGGLYYPTLRFLHYSTLVLVFLAGGGVIIFGPPHPAVDPVSVGMFVTFFAYSRRFAGMMRSVGDQVDTYNEVSAAARRVFGLVATPADVTEDDATALNEVSGAVAYDGVSFTYPGTDELAVSDVSFDVDPGEFVGLVGPTGAGKSTLCKLLLRFYDVDKGAIRVDGHDVRTLDVENLRSAIGYVGQEPFLFDGTVRENVRYGDRSATDEAVEDAIRRANAHAFVTELADGYETRIGERGVKLSGGQRQRLAIARSILADPPILVLDEATSHVDTETERLIQAGLAVVAEDRTTFAIAHSLATVRDADRILVVEGGRLVESGTHEELVAGDGSYADLWGVHVGTMAE